MHITSIFRKIRGFAFIMTITIIASCSKDKPTDNKPTAAKLIGTIQTWDDKTTSTTDASGVTITISNLTNVTATTDAAGKFSFESLGFDSYDFVISKAGYGTYKVYGINHAYNINSSATYTLVPSISFGKISTTTITALSVSNDSLNGEPGVSFNYSISPAPSASSRAFVRYFLSTSPDVSSTNYTAYSAVANFTNLSNNTGFTTNQLIGMGFIPGQTVYAKMYGDSFISNDYLDPNTGKRVFPNINSTSAPAVSFIVP